MANSESSKSRQRVKRAALVAQDPVRFGRPKRPARWSREAAVFVWVLLLILAMGAALFLLT
jgi:hypothetical protein